MFCAGLGTSGGQNPDNGFCRCRGRIVKGLWTVNVGVDGSTLHSDIKDDDTLPVQLDSPAQDRQLGEFEALAASNGRSLSL